MSDSPPETMASPSESQTSTTSTETTSQPASQPTSPSNKSTPSESPAVTPSEPAKKQAATPSASESKPETKSTPKPATKAPAKSTKDEPASSPAPAKESGVNWTSMLTFGLASKQPKSDLSEWVPDLNDASKIPKNLFNQPPTLLTTGQPQGPAMDPSLATDKFPVFTSVLPPLPIAASQLRFGWIDEYGDYHPVIGGTSQSEASKKINPKAMKAKEQAKELINSVISLQESLEKDKDPTSPRMSNVVKHRLSLEAGSAVIGVDNLVQVVEGKKGEKQVVVTEQEETEEQM